MASLDPISVPAIAAIAVLLILALSASVIDFKRMIIPDALSLALFASGMLAAFFLSVVTPLSAIFASAFGLAFMWLVQAGFRRHRGYDGLGFGDVKFVAAAAAWTGLEGLAVSLLVGSVSALFYLLARKLFDRAFDVKQPIPFGPFLALGFAFVGSAQILLGRALIDDVIAAFF